MDESEERIATNLRKGVLEYCVLALLGQQEMYGLELADTLVARGLTASEGSLYPLLARMRQADLVTTRWDTPDNGRPRRYYALTTRGRDQLATFGSIWRTIRASVDDLLEQM